MPHETAYAYAQFRALLFINFVVKYASMSTEGLRKSDELSPIALLTQAAEAQFAAAPDLVVQGSSETGKEDALYLAGIPVASPETRARFSGSIVLGGKGLNARNHPHVTVMPYVLTRETMHLGATQYSLITVPGDHFYTEGREEPRNIALWDTTEHDKYKGKLYESLHADTLRVLAEATPYSHRTHMVRPNLIKGEPDILVRRDSMRIIKFELGKRGVRMFFTIKPKHNR